MKNKELTIKRTVVLINLSLTLPPGRYAQCPTTNQNINNMKNKLSQEVLDSMAKNPSNWRGLLYFNRKDPRLVVQKLYPSLGWTFNFANPLTYLAIILLILIVVVVTIITK